MDYLRHQYSPSEIASELHVPEQQVRAAIRYIDEHRAQVEAEYQVIWQRTNRPNAPEVEAALAKTPDELRRRIMERRAGKDAHDRPGGP
jgi:hypothetical protein